MLTKSSLAGKKILLTGSSGFLGSCLTPQLLAAGATLKCLVRSQASALRIPPEAEVVLGDCADAASVAFAMRDCQIAIHMAGMLFGSVWQDYLRANGQAARNMAIAARNAGTMEKVILISSLAAAGPCGKAPGIDEQAAPAPVSAYGWSKLLTEEIMRAELEATQIDLVILRPPIIYGSGDNGLLPMFKLARAGFGLSPGLRDFPVSIIHVEDAANAILLSATDSRAKGLYHLSDGAIHNMEVICRAMGEALDQNQTRILKPPLPLMACAAGAASGASFLLRALAKACRLKPPAPPLFNLDKYRESAQCGWVANNAKIAQELAFSPKLDLAQGMRKTVAGYRQMGQL